MSLLIDNEYRLSNDTTLDRFVISQQDNMLLGLSLETTESVTIILFLLIVKVERVIKMQWLN